MDNSQFESSSIPKLLIKFSVPAIVGLLVNALYNIVDRFFIGKMPDVGALALSGIGVTFPITIIILSFAMLVGTGAASRLSIALGERNEELASKIVGNAFLLNIIFSVILTILGLVFYKPLLRAFGANAAILAYAEDYIIYILIGIVFANTASAMNSIIRAQGFAKTSMVTLLIGAVVNIVLDPILIFGLNMGVKGAGIATLLGQVVSAMWTLKFLLSTKATIPLKIKKLKIDWTIAIHIFSIGMAPFAMQLASALVEVMFNKNLSLHAGELGIGVFSTINSLIILFLMPVIGINQGSQPILGYFYGAKNHSKVRETYWISVIVSTILCTIGFLAGQFFPQAMLSVFNTNPEFLELGTHGMRILTLMLPVLGFQIISSNLFQAVGKAGIAMFLSLVRQVIILIPLILILPRIFGLNGVWSSTPISDGLATLVTTFFIVKFLREFRAEELSLK